MEQEKIVLISDVHPLDEEGMKEQEELFNAIRDGVMAGEYRIVCL